MACEIAEKIQTPSVRETADPPPLVSSSFGSGRRRCRGITFAIPLLRRSLHYHRRRNLLLLLQLFSSADFFQTQPVPTAPILIHAEVVLVAGASSDQQQKPAPKTLAVHAENQLRRLQLRHPCFGFLFPHFGKKISI
ncbi:hypothetical protein U1Q18_035288 [Sarracenia purpurea var. burkii]